MDLLSRAEEYFASTRGTYSTWRITDEAMDHVLEIEKDTRTQTDNDYVNVGCIRVAEKEHHLCVFYDDHMSRDLHAKVVLMTDDGTVMGTSLHRSEIPMYKDRDDVIWVSEDFIVFPEIVGRGEERFVLYPFPLPDLDEGRGEERFVLYPFPLPDLDEAIGCDGAIGTSPTVVSDTYLKEQRGIPIGQRIFTMIIGFDG